MYLKPSAACGRVGRPFPWQRHMGGWNVKPNARDIDAHVGRRMRQRREYLGISQGRLGRHLGLTFSQVQKYEKGSNRIGAGRLYMIAAFLGVPVQYFFEGLEGEAMPSPQPRNGRRGDELAVLEEAFLAITDGDTRRSVLALVRSLAAQAEGATLANESAQ
jgi:transcriptional regulator with XRE-family HTH domain